MPIPASPKEIGLSIARRDFEAVKRQRRFARRPYGCLLLARPGYFVQEDIAAALAGLGVRVTPVPILPEEGTEAFLERLLRAILASRPDFVLTMSHTGVDSEGTLVALLGELRLPLASWLVDSPDLILAGHPELAADHVVIFSCDAEALPAIRRLGYRHAHFLPLAAATARLAAGDRPRPPVPALTARISFLGEDFLAETARRLRTGRFGRELLGAYKPLAERWLASATREVATLFTPGEAALREQYLGLSPEQRRDFALIVLCRATTRYRAAILSAVLSLAPLVAGPSTWKRTLRQATGWHWHPPVHDPAFVAALFQGSAINLNATSAHMLGAANQRVFDVPAAGGFLLTDAGQHLGTLFEVGPEVAVYNGPADVLDQCQRYLHDEAARSAITRAARRRIEHEHTYGHRAAAMLHALKTLDWGPG
jgi:spore maturation protein CgeB